MIARSLSSRFVGVLVAGVGLLTLAGCGDDGGSATADDRASAATSSTDSSTGSSAGSSATADGASSSPATSTTPPAGDYTEAVFDVGSTPQGPRLYRELRSATGTPSLEAALTALTDQPTDPDYRTLWSSGAFTAATVTDSQIDVTIADQTLDARPSDLSAPEAKLAIQQVVYTAQAAAQRRLPVRFLIGDAPAATVLGVSTTDPIAAGDELSTLALVNVTTPEQGQTVTGPFTASGVGSSFEGTISWRVLDGSGQPVLTGSAQTDGDYTALTPWKTTVDTTQLPAGDYTFEASTGDAGEGPGPTTDTKGFTVG